MGGSVTLNAGKVPLQVLLPPSAWYCHLGLGYKSLKIKIITMVNYILIQVKHHKVPRLFVGTKKWQSVRRQNGSGCVEICRENASAVNMEPDGSLKLRVED